MGRHLHQKKIGKSFLDEGKELKVRRGVKGISGGLSRGGGMKKAKSREKKKGQEKKKSVKRRKRARGNSQVTAKKRDGLRAGTRVWGKWAEEGWAGIRNTH